jgi:hypothetical protein
VDTALLVVTILSLAAALVSVLAVRRIKYSDQRRSDARVAALAAAANPPIPLIDDLPLIPLSHNVVNRPAAVVNRPATPPTVVKGPPMSVDRPSAVVRRPIYNVEPAPALSSSRSMFGASLSPIEAPESSIDDRDANHDRESNRDRRAAIAGESFFGTVQRDAPSSGRFAFVAAAAVIVALGGAVVVFTTSGQSKDAVSAAAAARRAPLELLSLGHSREDSTITISGTVRNPARGPKLEGLTAVVSLVDMHGGLISTKDVPLDYRALGPGEEAPFKVTVPDSGSVARYRVSFRAGADVVPHVDRRGDTKLASAL